MQLPQYRAENVELFRYDSRPSQRRILLSPVETSRGLRLNENDPILEPAVSAVAEPVEGRCSSSFRLLSPVVRREGT